MKKIIILVLILFSIPVISQNNLTNEIYISSGYNMPQNPTYFSKYWFNAFNLNLGYNYPIMDYLVLQAEVGVNTFLFDEVKYRKRLLEYFNDPEIDESTFIVSGGMKQLYLFSLGAKVPLKELFSDEFYPYLMGGGGLTHNKTNDLIISGFRLESTIETVFHLYSGIGAGYIYSDKLTFFADGSYYYALTKNANKEKIPIDLISSYKEKKLMYLYFRFGVIYSL